MKECLFILKDCVSVDNKLSCRDMKISKQLDFCFLTSTQFILLLK